LEHIAFGKSTPLNRQVNSENLIKTLANLPSDSVAESIRVHIPRALRLVYDIRNKRDAAHLADGIDPNIQDAILVVGVIDWVLAEFLRLYHNVTPDEAHRLVTDIVSRAVPIVQDFDGHLKVLRPNLAASDHCLVLLYQKGAEGATFDDLVAWVRPSMCANLGRTLRILDEGKDFIHFDGSHYKITRLGQKEVEVRRLIDPVR
jgi:hypothetical protein